MIQNMRDLGGIVTRDGRRIRRFRLVRSANLVQAGETDLEHIAAVIDLRTPGERKEEPDRVYGRRYLALPVFDDIQAGISHEEETKTQGIPDMAYLYGKLINEHADSFRKILKEIMAHDFSEGAVLWHCTEGKDRCGITSALVLEILGADRDVIMEDYLKTNLVNQPKAAAIHEQLLATHGKAFADSVYKAIIADEKYLRAAWTAMGDNYFSEKLGIDEQAVNLFRNTVLE